ncbi:hypothetical protein [Micromonospora sp. WMMD964]|uniref:hypothetical protein n=1 Tax=Micromonospora sp. WMMD964 TaxID=3016091 RepID=UPI00249B76DB|nr:hypothetical protein [Micromonospora sp. WMMD964]WFE98597.1 hypothetical protein O7616_16940 [Micromonospora sp. WMMD964]
MTRAPRQLTRRSTRTGSGAGAGGGPAGASVADAGDFGRGQRVGQAAQQDTVGADLHEAAVEADGDAPAGEVVADGVLPAGQADQAGGVDEAFDFDRGAGPNGTGGDRGLPGRLAVVGEELAQVSGGESGRDGLESDAVDEQMDDGGVGPQGDKLGMSSSALVKPIRF